MIAGVSGFLLPDQPDYISGDWGLIHEQRIWACAASALAALSSARLAQFNCSPTPGYQSDLFWKLGHDLGFCIG